MQAIKTKFLGATNYKPSRVKATAEVGSVTLSWDHALNTVENHKAAAEALCARHEWTFDHKHGWLNADCYWVGG